MSRADDPRLSDLFQRSNPAARTKVALIGYPCDDGVARNHGRVGAKNGPTVFRKYLPKIGSVINPEFGVDLSSKLHVVDLGDAQVGNTLEETHASLRRKVHTAVDEGFIPVVIGGGNDQSYLNAKAFMDQSGSGDLAVVNIDAHLDARPLLEPGAMAHSGSPFRQLLEDPAFNRVFVEFGCQGSVCSADHAQYVQSKGGRLIWLSTLRAPSVDVGSKFADVLCSFGSSPVFVSFDIDSIKSADCPGVSAPATVGLTAEEALDICRAAGRHSSVRLLDMSEFNPQVEEDRTARLLVNMFYSFLLGLSERI